MGRPLNKKFFGDPTSVGFQIRATVNFGAGPEAAYVVKQRSNRKYLFTDVATEAKEMVCVLVDKLDTDLLEGEASITVDPFFGVESTAAANYDTDGSGNVTGITVTGGGNGYTNDFTVTVTDANTETADITFTVVDGVVTAGTLDSQSGAFTINLTDVAITMPAPSGEAGQERAKIINAHQIKTFNGNRYFWSTAAADESGEGDLDNA